MTSRNHKVFYSIISLVIAIAAWIFVVYNYDPMTTVRYKDIPIEFDGESTLAGRGYAVSEASRDKISVSLRQRRVNTNRISADDIFVIADVSNAVIGENAINLKINGPDGTSVVDSEVKSVTVEIEDADSKDLPILVEYSDADNDEAEPVTTDMTALTTRIVAAESVIDKVVKVSAKLSNNDVSTKSRSFTTFLTALDSEGEAVPHVQMYPSSVTYRATEGSVKEVRLSVDAVSKGDSSYKRTYSAPETVIVKGPPDLIKNLIQIRTQKINLNSYYEDTEIDVPYILPEGVVLANEQEPQTIKIKVRKIKDND
ncbi:MAG: hypothetical protein BZ136_09215 [Methanosphaera sp. rholeuAM74]|nr:MAG: hypothetical protein BZ136_09215 [Methanosphaera sp. rholeuAM74]